MVYFKFELHAMCYAVLYQRASGGQTRVNVLETSCLLVLYSLSRSCHGPVTVPNVSWLYSSYGAHIAVGATASQNFN